MRSIRTLAAAVLEAKAPPAGLPVGAQPTGTTFGVIVSIQAGPPPSLTITLGGSSTSIAGVRYLRSYTPVAGDTVLIWQAGADIMVVGPLSASLVSPAAAAAIATAETRANAAYGDLATPGPAVTVNTLTTAWVEVGAIAANSLASYCLMGVALSGASTAVAVDNNSAEWQGTLAMGFTFGSLVAGLTPGANTFTSKYACGGGGTGTWRFRNIRVTPLSV